MLTPYKIETAEVNSGFDVTIKHLSDEDLKELYQDDLHLSDNRFHLLTLTLLDESNPVDIKVCLPFTTRVNRSSFVSRNYMYEFKSDEICSLNKGDLILLDCISTEPPSHSFWRSALLNLCYGSSAIDDVLIKQPLCKRMAKIKSTKFITFTDTDAINTYRTPCNNHAYILSYPGIDYDFIFYSSFFPISKQKLLEINT